MHNDMSMLNVSVVTLRLSLDLIRIKAQGENDDN